jgi:hypothetical protein
MEYYGYKDLDDAMSELRALSGLVDSRTRGEDLRRVFGEDSDDKAKSIAGKEDMKGRLETLQERLKGVVDFVEEDNLKAATYTMKKIVEDAQDILETMGKEGKDAGKVTKQRNKTKDKEEKVAKDDDDTAKPSDVTHPAQREKEKERRDYGPGPGASADRAVHASRKYTDRFLSDALMGKHTFSEGEVIENLGGSDPFGLGTEFAREMRQEMGLDK